MICWYTRRVVGAPSRVRLVTLTCHHMTMTVALTVGCATSFGQTVTYQTFAEAKASTNTTTLSVPLPFGTVQGDLLIAAVATDGNNAVTLSPPSGQGWTLIIRASQTAVTFGVWWKIAGASEPGTHLFSWSASEEAYGWMMRFSGHDPVSPIHVFGESGSNASFPSSPQVTTTINNTLILRLGGFDGSAVTIDSTGLTGNTTITMDRSSALSGSAASGGAGFAQQPTAGASGLNNFTLTNSQAYRTVTLAIAPFVCTVGSDCADGDPCTDDVCTAGVCSNPNNTAPCSDGDPCTANDTCSAGVCVSGGPVDCSTAGGACNTAACDPLGADGNCDILTPVMDGTTCNDGNVCNIGEFCTAGVCGGGAPRSCQGFGDQCNDAACDPLGAEGNCDTLVPKADGTTCDDLNPCNVGETCQAGVCAAGAPPFCGSAGDQCNTASCDPFGPEGNCNTLTPVTDGTTCNDGDACNIGEFCTAGVCGGGAPRSCQGFGDQCNDAACDPLGAEGNCDTLVPKANGTTCDDLNHCNIGETCQAGVCAAGAPPDCSTAGDQCNTASCDPLGPEGNCNTLTAVTDGTVCNDGLFCTATDTCQTGTCSGTGNPCTTPLICDEATNACVSCLVNADCDDADPCTTDTCSAGVCTNAPAGQITVNVEVQGLGAAVSRDVTFVITHCGVGTDIRTATIAFDAAGLGSALLTGVDAASAWITGQEGHTLRRLAPLTFTSCAATVNMTGAALLETGDFQAGAVAQDNLVDITDFSILAGNWNQAIGASLSTGADATGDGLQGLADFTAVQSNFFSLGDAPDGCPLLLTGRRVRGRGGNARPTLSALVRRGVSRIPTARLSIPGARRADVNRDGVIDVRDVRLFARRNNLPLTPAFEKKLDRIEREETRNLRR